MPLTLDIASEAAARALERAPGVLLDGMTTIVTEVSLLAEREIRERTPIGVGGGGGLAGSISARSPRVSGTSVSADVGTSLRYATVVEMGRRPGQRQPPVRAIADWAKYKLGLGANEATRAAYPIARAIGARGTKGKYMFRDGLAAVEQHAERIVEIGVVRILERIAGGAA